MKELLHEHCDNDTDIQLITDSLSLEWDAYDGGEFSDLEYPLRVKSRLPLYLHENVDEYFSVWYKRLKPLPHVWSFVKDLKKQGIKVYILSNAPVVFADHAAQCYDIVKEFDGAVYSAPIKMAKPKEDIYRYLFKKYQLNPSDCFFLDDKVDNIITSQKVGMNGFVFKGDLEPVYEKIDYKSASASKTT